MIGKNLRILANNLHDSATLTATTEALPVDNTQRSERSRVWRSVGTGEQVIEADLSVGGFVDCFALSRHNLGSTGIIRVQLFDGATEVFDTGSIPTALLIPAGIWRAGIDAWGASYNDETPSGSALAVYWLDSPVAISSYKITISGGSVDGYYEIGRILIGLSFSPRDNFNWGIGVEWIESGEHIQTEAGSLRTIGSTADRRRKFDLKLDWLGEADRVILVSQLVKLGIGADLLVSLYPKGTSMQQIESTMVCRRETSLKHTHSVPRSWQAPLSFIEV